MEKQKYTRGDIVKNRKLWTDALRSGEYQQCTGVLRDADQGFCCLGVACDVAVKHGVEMLVSIRGGNYEYDDSWSSLPTKARAWLGLGDELSVDRIIHTLIDMNDKGAGFGEIASLIDGLPIKEEYLSDAD